MKLKQKIFGSFRSEERARQFCRIRGYLATLRKQGLNVWDALLNVFVGQPQSPLPQPKSLSKKDRFTSKWIAQKPLSKLLKIFSRRGSLYPQTLADQKQLTEE